MHVRNILLAVGIAALLVGVVLAVIWVRSSGAGAATQSAHVNTQNVLVAAAKIPTGTLLRREDVVWRAIAQDDVPPAAIVQKPGAVKSLLGAVARRDFGAGDVLIPSGFVKPGERGFLAAVLHPGMRAISIAVNAASSAAGLVQPDDRVDVILAQNLGGRGRTANAVGETVLQNIRVIAVDQWFEGHRAKPTGGLGPAGSRVPKTVTLEVDEHDAKRLLVAGQLGTLTLAVRALTGAYADATRPDHEGAPVWASDVSYAAGRRSGAHRRSSRGTAVRILRGLKAGGQ